MSYATNQEAILGCVLMDSWSCRQRSLIIKFHLCQSYRKVNKPFAMMVDLQKKYNWVLDTLSYNSIETLIKALKPAIIDPAIQKRNELRLIKAREPKIRSANDFIEDKGME